MDETRSECVERKFNAFQRVGQAEDQRVDFERVVQGARPREYTLISAKPAKLIIRQRRPRDLAYCSTAHNSKFSDVYSLAVKRRVQ